MVDTAQQFSVNAIAATLPGLLDNATEWSLFAYVRPLLSRYPPSGTLFGFLLSHQTAVRDIVVFCC